MGIGSSDLSNTASLPMSRRGASLADAGGRAGPSLRQRMAREWRMYVLIVPGFVYFVVFRYVPFLGNIVAFQNYSPFLGFLSSPWVGIDNFTALFSDPEAVTALKNTLIISFLQIVFAFPAPLLLALLLNSVLSSGVKRFI
ncbi:MAG: sugar ABC transporter permease, partial [bacterium]